MRKKRGETYGRAPESDVVQYPTYQNPLIAMKVRDRSWIGCDFMIKDGFLRGSTWQVLAKTRRYVFVQCMFGRADLVGGTTVFGLDDECVSPEYVPLPIHIKQKARKIRQSWSPETRCERYMEGIRADDSEIFRSAAELAERWELEDD